MFKALEEISNHLEKAQEQAGKRRYSEGVTAIDQALDVARRVRDERNQALDAVTATWYQTWYRRVREANGRHVARTPQNFVDTQSTEAARRRQEGLAYLIEREFSLPFGDWVNQVQDARNRYAADHKFPARGLAGHDNSAQPAG
jgi:hexosaminidase